MATVLGEELAYNRALQQFKMFILDRPLDPNYKVDDCRMCSGGCSYWNQSLPLSLSLVAY